MSYDFSHWGEKLPKVSCQCITYGRPQLLNEAVMSFLRQDYSGEKELVILNDQADVELSCDIPNVKVYNYKNRIASIGEKRNECVRLCTGDVIFPWDDDDISLPHRMSFSLSKMTNHHYFKGDCFWFWESGKIRETPVYNVAHAMGCFSRSLFDQVGGYDHIQSGQDTSIENKFRTTKMRQVHKLNRKEAYYIYKFNGNGSYHLSWYGYGKGFEQSEKFVKKKNISGHFKITPQYADDYEGKVQVLADRTVQ